MILEIRHLMSYEYADAVDLASYTLKLRPRCDVTQKLSAFELKVDPVPQSLVANVDLDGNMVHAMWFSGSHRSLSIDTFARVETLRVNPLDFVFHDSADARLPLRYASELAGALAPYLGRPEPSLEVDALAQTLYDETFGDTLKFLLELTRRIHALCETEHRDEGPPRTPRETLAVSRGACRDLAVLMCDACRSQGLASRFVSGYMEGAQDNSELHAWTEIYLPGGGWRGFDPSVGLAVADHHVAVAAGPDPEHAAPGLGTFHGKAGESVLHTRVSIRECSE
jgi:transglutaminase-like putative cysteine protease